MPGGATRTAITSPGVARSAGLIGLATTGSRLLGVAREIVLAGMFGASAGPAMDAYNVAFRIPNLVRDLFAEGAMSAAFIPTFTRALAARGREAAWRLGNLVINALLLATGLLVILGIAFADPITAAIAGDEFAAVPGKLQLTADLTRVMLPFLTSVAVAVAMMGMLNSLHRFFIPALSPAMFNVATILSAFAIVPLMPMFGLPPIMGIAIGTLLGGLGQIALQWPLLHREGYRYEPVLDFKDPGMLEILKLMGPGTLGLAAVQINVLVNTYLATTQEQGAVSWLGYAFRLMYLPIGVFGVSIAVASLPDISRHAGDEDRAAVRRIVSNGLRMMLMLNIPATVGLMVLSLPIVQLIYERHNFLPRDSVNTAAALMFYAPGLLGYSAVKIASPTFYSMRDSRTPVLVSLGSVAINLALNLLLVQVMGFRGLALGTATAALLNALVLLFLLRGRLHGLEGRRLGDAALRILTASAVMGVAVWYAAAWLPGALPFEGFWNRLVTVLAAIATGLAVLVAAARALRLEELDTAMRRVSARLGRAR